MPARKREVVRGGGLHTHGQFRITDVRDSEIGQDGVPSIVQKDVGGLDVTVDNAVGMQEVQSIQNVAEDFANRPHGRLLRQGVQQIHREVGTATSFSKCVNVNKMRVAELRQKPCLRQEAFTGDGIARRCEELECKIATQRRVMDSPDFACRATSEISHHAKTVHGFARFQQRPLCTLRLPNGIR